MITGIRIGATLALTGEASEAEAFLRNYGERYSTHTLGQRVGIPLTRAYLALRAGQATEALAQLEIARPYERAFPEVVYARGLAQLAAGDGAAAVQEFARLSGELKSVYTGIPTGVIAKLGEARGYRMSGDLAAARNAYLDFLALWKDADEDVPLLLKARAEYEALPGVKG